MKVLPLLYGHVKWILSFATVILKPKMTSLLLGFRVSGHTTNNDLLNKIEDETSMVNMKNLEQSSINCPNVNWKFFHCFINERESKKRIGSIKIISCNLHVVNSVFKSAANAIDWNLHKLMKACFQILHPITSKKGRLYHHHWFKCFPFLFLCNSIIFRLII